MTYANIQAGIRAIKADCEDLLFNNVSELCVNAVRGCLVAEPGKKLLVADLSNIEGRVLAWLAGENWKIAAFKAFDAGTGHDLYKLTAALILNKLPEDVTKDERQAYGKVPELALGYQGAVGAFNSMAGNYGVYLEEDVIIGIVKGWRRRHPNINSLWYNLEDAAKSAIRNPDESFRVGKLTFSMKDGWLRMRLPSGRYLSYPKAQIGVPCRVCKGSKEQIEADGSTVTCRACGGSGLDDTQIRYWGINQYTRKWEMLETYGGKFCEQACQSTARDIFLYGMRRAEKAGYPVVLRVHDELGCEVPNDPSYTVEALCGFMTAGEPWSLGLPLAAAGDEMYRYSKGD